VSARYLERKKKRRTGKKRMKKMWNTLRGPKKDEPEQVTTFEISGPTGFKHEAHVGIDGMFSVSFRLLYSCQ